MAKTSSIQKNKRRRSLTKKFEVKRAELKAIIYNKELPFEERFAAQIKLSELPRNGAKVRIRNRCELTGRPRAYYRKFRISRIMLRDLASIGQVPGVIKASW